MYIHGFQSKDGSEVRVYTLELVSERKVDRDLEIEVLTPAYLLLAVVTMRRQRGGLEHIRGTMTYDVKKGFDLSNHTAVGRLTEEEVSVVNQWTKKNGKVLVQWMRRCPVTPIRGRTYATPAEDA